MMMRSAAVLVLLAAAMPAFGQGSASTTTSVTPPPSREPDLRTSDVPADQPVPGTSEAGLSALKITLDLLGGAELESDFKNDANGGSVSVYRASFLLAVSYKVSQALTASAQVQGESSWFNVNNAQALTPGSPRPFGTFGQLTISPSATYAFDKEWALTAGGIINFAGEDDADIGDTFTGGGYLAATYRFSDKFRLSFGVIGISRLEESFFAYPYVGIDWQINDKVSFKLYGNQNGPEARITGKIAEDWSVFLYAAYQSRSYRLSDTSPLPDGVFRERSVPVMLGVNYKVCDNFELNAGGGAIAWRRLRTDNSQGIQVGQIETDPGAALFLGGRLSF